MAYIRQYDGLISAILTDAYVFAGEDVGQGKVPSKRLFTHNAAWDTRAEVTIISPRVVEA